MTIFKCPGYFQKVLSKVFRSILESTVTWLETGQIPGNSTCQRGHVPLWTQCHRRTYSKILDAKRKRSIYLLGDSKEDYEIKVIKEMKIKKKTCLVS